jgi:hypothetical protein
MIEHHQEDGDCTHSVNFWSIRHSEASCRRSLAFLRRKPPMPLVLTGDALAEEELTLPQSPSRRERNEVRHGGSESYFGA